MEVYSALHHVQSWSRVQRTIARTSGSNPSPLMKRFRAFIVERVPSVEVQLAHAADEIVIVCTRPGVSPTSSQRPRLTTMGIVNAALRKSPWTFKPASHCELRPRHLNSWSGRIFCLTRSTLPRQICLTPHTRERSCQRPVSPTTNFLGRRCKLGYSAGSRMTRSLSK